MGKIRRRRIAAASLLIAAATFGLLRWLLDSPPTLSATQADLDRALKHRFEHGRGLSPCDLSDRHELMRMARAALTRAGVPSVPLVAVIAPTFSGAKVVAFGNSNITVVSFAGDTGYTPLEFWFSKPLQARTLIAVSPREQYTITAPLIRHTQYASTTSRGGLDGVTYFLDFGDHCAYTWSPRKDDGPSSLIAGILQELAKPAPDLASVMERAENLERVDRDLGR